MLNESARGLEVINEAWAVDALLATDELEIGSLIAALSAETEDEYELDDRFRALVESGRFRVAIGSDSAAVSLGN